MHKNMVKFGCVVLKLYEWTDRHTDKQASKQANKQINEQTYLQHNSSHPSWGEVTSRTIYHWEIVHSVTSLPGRVRRIVLICLFVALATSMTSVCLSVTLVDCDIMQQKVEITPASRCKLYGGTHSVNSQPFWDWGAKEKETKKGNARLTRSEFGHDPSISWEKKRFCFCPYHMNFDLDVDLEHILDAGARPGYYVWGAWSSPGHGECEVWTYIGLGVWIKRRKQRVVADAVLKLYGLKVSPKFLHVPLGVGGWLLGYEERRCWGNCSHN